MALWVGGRVGTLVAGCGIIPPFSQLSDFGSFGTSSTRPATVINTVLLQRLCSCGHLQALAPVGERLGPARAGAGRGDEASQGERDGSTVGSSVSASGDGRLVLPWPAIVGLLTPSPDHLERIKRRGVQPIPLHPFTRGPPVAISRSYTAVPLGFGVLVLPLWKGSVKGVDVLEGGGDPLEQ